MLTHAPYEIQRERDVLVATPMNFEVDPGDMLELASELCSGVRSDACRLVLVDLTNVAYLSSACLGELLNLARDIEPMRAKVVLAGAVAAVREMLEVTRLCEFFDGYETMEEAREELELDA